MLGLELGLGMELGLGLGSGLGVRDRVEAPVAGAQRAEHERLVRDEGAWLGLGSGLELTLTLTLTLPT